MSLVFLVKDDGPTARDLMVRYATSKKTSKRKKKLEKAMKVLKVRSVVSDLLVFSLIFHVWKCCFQCHISYLLLSVSSEAP